MRRLGAVNGDLERLDADAPIRVDEALVVRAQREIRVDDPADRARHLRLRQTGSEPVAERRVLVRRAAERELEELLAALVDAEDADVADVVVPAGVHAARDVDREVTDALDLVDVRELVRDVLRDRNRT